MPAIKEHIKLSLKRTRKSYKEIHEWIEGIHSTRKEKEERHDILKIPKFLPFIEEKFGEEGVKEYLQHIKDDYERTKVYRLVKGLMRLKFW